MDAVRGPDTPMVVRNSEMLGVRRKGTGRLASRSPVASLMSKRKYATLSLPVSWGEQEQAQKQLKELISLRGTKSSWVFVSVDAEFQQCFKSVLFV